MNEIYLANELKNALNKGCRFVSFKYQSKTSNETARHTVLLGARYVSALKRDIEQVKTMEESQARQEVLKSLSTSLVSNANGQFNPSYTRKNENRIDLGKGLKLVDSGLTIRGYSVNKTVITPGTHKEVKSNPLTIEKNKIRKQLRTGKFREFCLSNVLTIKVNGKTIEVE